MADTDLDIDLDDDATAADDNEIVEVDDLFVDNVEELTDVGDDTETGGLMEALNGLSGVKERPWMRDVKMHLVTSVEMLHRVVDECIAAGVYAVDSETTGLDNRVIGGRTKDVIVGIGLSPDGKTAYYTPIRHRMKSGATSPANLPVLGAFAEFRRLFASDAVARTHNGKFDFEFFEFPDDGQGPLGTFDKPSRWDDSLILAYLADPRQKNKRLKHLAKTILGHEMVELDELFDALLGDKSKKGKAAKYHGPLNFALLDPSLSDVLRYACGDVLFTFRLVDHYKPLVIEPDQFGQQQRAIYQIEKGCVAATRWMERNRIHIDRAKVGELIVLGQKEMFEALCDVYDSASTLLERDISPAYFRALRVNPVLDNPSNLLQTQMAHLRTVHAKDDPVETVRDAKGREKDAIIRVAGKDGHQRPIIYDVLAPAQLGEMLEEMGVQGLSRTAGNKATGKQGQINTSKKELDRIVEAYKDTLPFMKKVRRFRETLKALSSYLVPLYGDIDDQDHTARINYQAHKVDTGRFSTPAKEAADDAIAIKSALNGWPNINLQSLPATYDKKRPECLLRLRECVTPRQEGWYIVAIDYSGVELRLVTNLSGEPMWVTEFFRCADCGKTFERGDGSCTPLAPPPFCPKCGSDKIGDLHTLTGLSVYGKDARSRPEWKKLRGNSKACNFAMCYGGGGRAASRATGCDDNEGWRIKRQFDATYRGLARWWDSQHREAKERGYVCTAFGRKYPVPDILLPKRDPKTGRENSIFIAKAERNSVNGPIQGTSADVTKLAMTLIYQDFQRRNWLDKALLTITMHDELVFEVHGSILEEFIAVTVPLMTRNDLILKKRWQIPLTCDVEIGTTWNVDWDLKELRHKNEWPAELVPLFRAASGGTVLHEQPIVSPLPVPSPPEENARVASDVVLDAPETSTPVELIVAQPPSDGAALAALLDGIPEIPAPLSVVDDDPLPASWEAEAPANSKPIEIPAPPLPVSAPVGESPVGPPVSVVTPGTPYIYKLRCNLTTVHAFELAKIIRRCRNQGTQPLRLLTKDGIALDGVTSEPILVNGAQFYWLAHEAGL